MSKNWENSVALLAIPSKVYKLDWTVLKEEIALHRNDHLPCFFRDTIFIFSNAKLMIGKSNKKWKRTDGIIGWKIQILSNKNSRENCASYAKQILVYRSSGLVGRFTNSGKIGKYAGICLGLVEFALIVPKSSVMFIELFKLANWVTNRCTVSWREEQLSYLLLSPSNFK